MFNKEIQQQQREIIQTEAERLSKEHKHLLLTWATGCGKGRAVMRCIQAADSDKQWLVICPETIQVENFKVGLEEHGFAHLLNTKIKDVICYASFDKYIGGEYNLALNEVHRLSELKHSIAQTIKFEQIISDSATVPYEVRERLYEIQPYHEYPISLVDAIQRGILPEPTFYIKKIQLNQQQKKEVSILNNKYNYWRTRFYADRKPFFANKMNQARGDAKKLLASYKTHEARNIINNLAGQRFVCFTGSVEQSMELDAENSINSKKTKKINLQIIEKFNTFDISSRYFNRMGREGMNFNAIDAGIIIQLDSGNDEGLSFIQTTGRALRGDDPKLYILCTDAEQDEQYLRRALSNVNSNSIVYI